MMRRNLYILAIASLLSGNYVFAQDAVKQWSLEECIQYAIEHNIDIRRTANAAEQSNVEVNTAKWARLPNLNASAGQNWNWGRTQTAIKDESTGDYSTVYVNTGSHGTNMSVFHQYSTVYRTRDTQPVCFGQIKPKKPLLPTWRKPKKISPSI